MLKNQKGITLVALVITIIVLLILAAVTMSLVLGDNGIIGKAQTAQSTSDKAAAKEIVDLAIVAVKADKLDNTRPTAFATPTDYITALQANLPTGYTVATTSPYYVTKDASTTNLVEVKLTTETEPSTVVTAATAEIVK